MLQCFTLELAIFFQGAVNVPLFDDEARALVGTDFKRKGRYEADSAPQGVYVFFGEKHEKQRGMGRAGWHPEIDIYHISWIILDISYIRYQMAIIYDISDISMIYPGESKQLCFTKIHQRWFLQHECWFFRNFSKRHPAGHPPRFAAGWSEICGFPGCFTGDRGGQVLVKVWSTENSWFSFGLFILLPGMGLNWISVAF